MHRVLAGILNNGNVSSAYLFVGPPGPLKGDEARAFAEKMGCKGLDLIWTKPDGATVKIDQVRELQRAVRYGPSQSERLVVVVEGADLLTTEAAGSFLKVLEEPPAKVTFILLVERLDRLPATISSRCQQILFGEAPQEWRPDPALAEWYSGLKALKGQGPLERLAFSARLEKEKERIEELLDSFLFFARYELKDLALTRLMLETIKNVKRKANLKLALDVACLKI
ncbi:MAG TPA: hypothetical protein VMT55_05705 [Candidatus Sulfotelmatobacter sp.]|nr:hypothetical protein [Candidatus Sulfotelmatobacter sp.]